MSKAATRSFRVIAFLALALVAVWTTAFAQPKFPTLSGRVVDQANVLSATTRTELTALFEAHERATSNQVVVATVASLQGYDIADFGVQLGRAWKLGQGDRNNGVMLLVAPNEREVRIEVGYGLEGPLPDALAFQIIQTEILPRFRANNVDGGVLAGARAILGAIEGTYKGRPAQETWRLSPEVEVVVVIMLIIAFVLFLIFLDYLSRGPKNRFGPRDLGRRTGQSGGDAPGWGSFGGGGGSFGGGGASGKW